MTAARMPNSVPNATADARKFPRKPAQKPWLALGISRSTYYYRRQKKAREQAALAAAMAQRQAMFDRLEWMLAELRADLDRVMGTHAEAAAIFANVLG